MCTLESWEPSNPLSFPGGVLLCKDKHRVPIVEITELIFLLVSALRASMHQCIRRRASFNSYGLHHAEARSGAIARIHINMLAPQTPRAMVRIARPSYVKATVPADEILDSFREALRGHAT